MEQEHEPNPDTWFPRHRRGSCIAGGPGTGSTLTDRIIDQKIDERRPGVLARKKELRQKKLDENGRIFQAYYEALAKFISPEEAEERTQAVYAHTCLGKPTTRVRAGCIIVQRKFRMPMEHELAELRLFAEAVAGTAPNHTICPKCHCILKKAKAAIHPQRCPKTKKTDEAATSAPTGVTAAAVGEARTATSQPDNNPPSDPTESHTAEAPYRSPRSQPTQPRRPSHDHELEIDSQTRSDGGHALNIRKPPETDSKGPEVHAECTTTVPQGAKLDQG